jgi:hypothetical protein
MYDRCLGISNIVKFSFESDLTGFFFFEQHLIGAGETFVIIKYRLRYLVLFEMHRVSSVVS